MKSAEETKKEKKRTAFSSLTQIKTDSITGSNCGYQNAPTDRFMAQLVLLAIKKKSFIILLFHLRNCQCVVKFGELVGLCKTFPYKKKHPLAWKKKTTQEATFGLALKGCLGLLCRSSDDSAIHHSA